MLKRNSLPPLNKIKDIIIETTGEKNVSVIPSSNTKLYKQTIKDLNNQWNLVKKTSLNKIRTDRNFYTYIRNKGIRRRYSLPNLKKNRTEFVTINLQNFDSANNVRIKIPKKIISVHLSRKKIKNLIIEKNTPYIIIQYWIGDLLEKTKYLVKGPFKNNQNILINPFNYNNLINDDNSYINSKNPSQSESQSESQYEEKRWKTMESLY